MNKDRAFEEKLANVLPNERHLKLLNMGYYNFIHFGINTFTGKEWGSGKEPLTAFGLKSLDADRWVLQLMSTGSKGVILTAKHHDGFCLFPSKYTDYTIAGTSYKGGKGDIVGELAASCAKYGFPFGVYLSPWDRHEPSYGTDAYNDYYCNQLTELLTNYGKIFCVWLDGACGEGPNGRKQIYDFERYYKLIHKLQPGTIISNTGPDSRWIGNERGKGREAEFSVVPKRLQSFDAIAAASQQEGGAFKMLRPLSHNDRDLGARHTIDPEEPLCYWPSEMDIPITYIGWFYRPVFKALYSRTAGNLVRCYCRSVGNNATLIVNVPPDKEGRLPDKFICKMVKARRKLQHLFAEKINSEWQKISENSYRVTFPKARVSKLILTEDITRGQRIEEFTVIADGKEVYRSKTVGYKKFCFFKSVQCSSLDIIINKSRLEPYISGVKVYR